MELASEVIAPVGSRRLPILGLILMLLFAVAGGLVMGVLFYLSSKLIYLVLFSPIIAAAIAGYVLGRAVHWGKVRSKSAVLVIGLIMGLITTASYWYAGYLDGLYSYIVEQGAAAEGTPAINRTLDFVLHDDPGQTAFFDYFQSVADAGMTITPTHNGVSTGDGFTLDRQQTLIYFGIELLILVVGPILVAWSEATKPFCEGTNRWIALRPVGYVLGDGMQQFLDAASRGDYKAAGALMGSQTGKLPMLRVWAGSCEGGRAVVKVTRLVRRNSKTVLDNVTITPQQYQDLTQGAAL